VVRIFIVDDSAVIRSHLREMLEQRSDWVVVGEACNGRDAVETLSDHKPDLTVMDFQMPEMDGLEAPGALPGSNPMSPF